MSIILVVGVVGGVAYTLRRRYKKAEAIRKAGELKKVSEIVSCLVAQVYACDGGQREHASKMWKALGYEEHDLREDQSPEHIVAAGMSACTIRFMVFRRRDTNIRGTMETWTAQRPQYVVALRGTKPRCPSDLSDDLLHLVESLHKSDAFKVVLEMTEKTVHKYKTANVCITGHSLGAAFGLLVGRKLALDGHFVETHLYNPPFLTLATLIRKGLKCVPGAACLVAQLPKPIRDMLDSFSEFIEYGVYRDTNLQEEMSGEFSRLQAWTPNLYVNTHDLVCNEYINYFKREAGLRRSVFTSTRVYQKARIDAKSYHLIPSAVLHTNDRSDVIKIYVCHKLDQWYKYPTTGASTRYKLDLSFRQASAV